MNYQKNLKYKIKYTEFILQGGANLKILSASDLNDAAKKIVDAIK